MLILNVALVWISLLLFIHAMNAYHAILQSDSCPMVKANTLRILGALPFLAIAYICSTLRWISLNLSDQIPSTDDVLWSLIEGVMLYMLLLFCDLCRSWIKCQSHEQQGKCAFERRVAVR
ncbi:MAG: hypothetical protein HC889_17125 [Synechococcaceae cyanobacterium SM1_2_3]|nr:hypothetical protein [Synechococcaceae cyanobacterium SM1_2_3]